MYNLEKNKQARPRYPVPGLYTNSRGEFMLVFQPLSATERAEKKKDPNNYTANHELVWVLLDGTYTYKSVSTVHTRWNYVEPL